MGADMNRVLTLFLLSSSLYGVAGCSNGQCSEAKLEEVRLSKKMESLSNKYVKSEEELRVFLENYCANLEVGEKSLLDATREDIWCDDWKKTGNTPPIGGDQMTEITGKIQDVKFEFENTQNRWALTVTTYKECFEASMVIDATEILND